MDDETKSLLIAVVVKVAVDSMKGFGFSLKECAVAFRAGLFAMEEIERGVNGYAKDGTASACNDFVMTELKALRS